MHPLWQFYHWLPMFSTRSYVQLTNTIIYSLVSGRPINAWNDIFLQNCLEYLQKGVSLYHVWLELYIPFSSNQFGIYSLSSCQALVSIILYFVLFFLFFISQPWFISWRFRITPDVQVPLTSNISQMCLAFYLMSSRVGVGFSEGIFLKRSFIWSW